MTPKLPATLAAALALSACSIQPPKVETAPGVVCWRESRPIERIGIYIPGGSAPLFSTVLMLALPAKIAGCKEIVLCTPPDARGEIHPAIRYTAWLTGVTKLYAVGGIQAMLLQVLDLGSLGHRALSQNIAGKRRLRHQPMQRKHINWGQIPINHCFFRHQFNWGHICFDSICAYPVGAITISFNQTGRRDALPCPWQRGDRCVVATQQ